MNRGGARARSVLKQQAEPKPPPKIVDPLEGLTWSDDEGDYLVKVPKRKEADELKFDVEKHADQPSIVHTETHSDHTRNSKLFNELHIGGDAKIHTPKPLLPREIRKPAYASFRLPLPYCPQHVKESLGLDILEHLWFEFLEHGADESELVQIKNLKSINSAMKVHLGYEIPLEKVEFPSLDDDDYVDFREVVLGMVLWADRRQQFVQQRFVKEKTEVLGRCCAVDACTIKSTKSGRLSSAEAKGGAIGGLDRETKDEEHDHHEHDSDGEEGDAKRTSDAKEDHSGNKQEAEENKGGNADDEDEDEGEYKLHVAWMRYRLDHKGTVRIKHICELMEEVLIPYDKSRIPSSEWTIRGELLLTDPALLQSLCERIRSDKDYERNKAVDDIYSLPRWMENEFSASEIMLFKHQFRSIDIDGGGALDAGELVKLTAQMGNEVSDAQAEDLIGLMDMDGSGTVDFSEFMMLLYKIQNGVIDLEGNMLAQAMIEAKTQISIFDEIEELHRDPPPYGHVINYGGNPVQCDIAIAGPENTLYEGGTFRLRVILLNGYPFRLPDITFQTRVYHVNVLSELDGLGYFPHIKYLWDSSWSLRRLIAHVVDLMRNPRLDYVPVELVRIVKVFFWEEKEKRRVAEEQRLAELARIAELERLAEFERLKQEQIRIELEMQEALTSLKERKVMAGEDQQNDFEIDLMLLEDVNVWTLVAADEEEQSVATFTADDGEKKTDTARQSKETSPRGESANIALSSEEKKDTTPAAEEDASDDDWGDAKRTRKRKGPAEAKLEDLADAKFDISMDAKLSARGNVSDADQAASRAMMSADAKDGASCNSRRGSKGLTPPHSARSHKSDNYVNRNDENVDDDEDDDEDDEETGAKQQAPQPVEESFPGLNSQDMLKPLMRVQQMHLTVVQFFLGEKHRYDENVRDYVRKFAWTTQPTNPKPVDDAEDNPTEEAQEALLRWEKEGFSLLDMSGSLQLEYGLKMSAGTLGVWFHQKKMTERNVWCEIEDLEATWEDK